MTTVLGWWGRLRTASRRRRAEARARLAEVGRLLPGDSGEDEEEEIEQTGEWGTF